MSERPLLVSGPLIGPILRGEKTVTRRLLNRGFGPQFAMAVPHEQRWTVTGDLHQRHTNARGKWVTAESYRCPYGAVGDVLWVRETWSHTGDGVWSPRDARGAANGHLLYRADGEPPGVGWFPSIHMPRWAARIFLRVESVGVERVQDITEEDARAEGIGDVSCSTATETWRPTSYRLACDQCGEQFSTSRGCNGPGLRYAKAAAQERWAKHIGSARVRFAALWDSLAPAGSKWADNPWCWRIAFKLEVPHG